MKKNIQSLPSIHSSTSWNTLPLEKSCIFQRPKSKRYKNLH